MNGETDLNKLLKTMKPVHNVGDYVFCTTFDPDKIPRDKITMMFRESEGYTVVLKKEVADRYSLAYTFIGSWITLVVHSSLEAVGLTAAFASALSKNGISCNVVAAFYHDHIFIPLRDTEKAMSVLKELGGS
ncbi:MAG: ACT domain-containing protein [Chryseolinea sp.]